MGETIVIENIQLRKITVDSEYEKAIQNKLIALQLKRTAEIDQSLQKIQKEIDKSVAETDADIQLIYAESEATAIKTRGKAEAEADQTFFETETLAYKTANADLALYVTTDQVRTNLMHYIYVNSFRYIDNSLALVVGFKKPIITIDG